MDEKKKIHKELAQEALMVEERLKKKTQTQNSHTLPCILDLHT
jgi:hypothetical protein